METTDALFNFVKEGNMHALMTWFAADAPVNAKDAHERTPLHWAAHLGHADVAKFLIERGARIYERDVEGKSALLTAAEYGRVEVAKVLLAAGAIPNVRAITSETALHLAVRCSGASRDPQGMTELLAEQKYMLDFRDKLGRTALMITAKDNNAGMMRALLNAGADPELRDNEGRTAADWARQTGADYALQVLLCVEAARDARKGLTRDIIARPALKFKNPSI